MQRIFGLLDVLESTLAQYLAALPNARKQMNNALPGQTLIGPGADDIRVEMRDEVTEVLTM